MQVTNTPPPALATEDVQHLLLADYGIEGTLRPLVSERDQNFRVDAAGGRRFVAKIANASEAEAVTEFQVLALQHLQRSGCPVPVPRVVPARDGSLLKTLVSGEDRYRVRLVTWVPGKPAVEHCPSRNLAAELGAALARIDAGLADFAHPGERQELLWDMQRALEVGAGVGHVPDRELRARVSRCFDDFERSALPALGGLREQVIHNDLNPGNFLLTEGQPAHVAGVIDFGDMLRAPLVVDVAIAASYLRSDAKDALAPAAALVAGFGSITPLGETELSLVHGLMRTRLATTIVMMYTRLAARSDQDAYLAKTLRNEGSAARFLERLEALGQRAFGAQVITARRRYGLQSPDIQ